MRFKRVTRIQVAVAALCLAACNQTGTGTLHVHWDIQGPQRVGQQCQPGDQIHVNIGDNNHTYPCDNGGSGSLLFGVATYRYLGGAEIPGVFAGGPYNILLELIDGQTGYIVTQTEVDQVGDIPDKGVLDVGVVVLTTPTAR